MIAQSVAKILADAVTLSVEGVDRMYLNVYVPRPQTEQGIVWFFREHGGQPLPSAALMSPLGRRFVAALETYAAEHGLRLVQFRKGQRKDEVMAEHLRKFGQDEGAVFIGKAQAKTPVLRTEKRRNPRNGQPYPWIVRSTAMVNHYYVYAVDRDFGPFFLKFCSDFPFNAKLYLNGHEYAKRQRARKGIAFEALDNGVLSCADPGRLQQICDGLSAQKIDGLLRKWLRLLPHPFTGADRKAGYRPCSRKRSCRSHRQRTRSNIPMTGQFLHHSPWSSLLDVWSGLADSVTPSLSGTTAFPPTFRKPSACFTGGAPLPYLDWRIYPLAQPSDKSHLSRFKR